MVAKSLKSSRIKICEGCQTATDVAFRIRVSPQQKWIFVCKTCCEKAAILPGYQYGGTWKGIKK